MKILICCLCNYYNPLVTDVNSTSGQFADWHISAYRICPILPQAVLVMVQSFSLSLLQVLLLLRGLALQIGLQEFFRRSKVLVDCRT